MIIRSPSLFRLDHLTMAVLLVALALVLPAVHGAPVYESDQTEMETYGESTGCYYNYNHYGEGDRIMTNEPCLNCTCHDRMLMCYLRVCPFTKAIGQDCTIEKREDQCCPVITCPAVEVQLLDHQTTASPSTALGGAATSDVGALDQYGCSISGRFYPDGAQVPSNPQKPCELCYCIRNMTTCVMQECTLHIDGCQPIYNKGVCCPVRYDCDHDKDTTPMLDDELTTTVRPTPGFILTTTVSPSVSTDCVHNGETYADGALIMTDKPCEHCYCMRGDIVCAVQECGTPLENEGKNCVALPPAAGQCCPDKYMCDGGSATPTTTASAIPTTTTTKATVADASEEEQQKVSDDYVPSDDLVAAPEPTTLQTDTSKATTSKPLLDTDSQEKEDDDSEQQQQQHVVPQFEDVQEEDDSEDEEQREDAVQVPKKTDEEHATTTARSADDEVEHDHIPGHVGSHEHKEQSADVGTTVAPAVDSPAATVRPDTTDKPEAADDTPIVTPSADASPSTVRAEATDKPETADVSSTTVGTASSTVQSETESADEGTTVAPAVGTSPSKAQADTTDKTVRVEQDEVPSEQSHDDHVASGVDQDDDSELDQKIDDSYEGTSPSNLHFDEPSAQTESTTLGAVPEEPRVTTTRPAAVPTDDEKENEIGATHDDEKDGDEFDQTEQSKDEQEQTVEMEKDDDEQVATTPAAGERHELPDEVAGTTSPAGDESASTPAAEKELEQTTLMHREQQPTKLDVTTEKKEPTHKADDVPQPPQDFVELPPAVIVTELPPVPISEERLSITEQTLAPPKDEILPNMPLEADSHVLDESTTTEYTLASGDHKKQEAEAQHPVLTSDDFDEPIEMNTVITPEKDEQKPQQSVDTDQSEEQHEVEHEPVGQHAHDSDEDDSEEDSQPGDEHGDDAAPTTATPAHSVVQPAEQEKDGENETEIDETPDKLFPESIPGEGDCLIDGVTYENGASVPASGKCQVACRCSNSIVHCEAVRCEPAPNAECTAKTIVPGECCPRYDCPDLISSTTTETVAVSSVDDASKDASDSVELSDLFATGSEASIGSGSTEASDISTEAASIASTADSQASSGEDQEEDDESGQPSEAESDSAGWDLDNDVFKPLLPQEPMLDMMNNLSVGFNGNRISTDKYDDVIVLTTAAPTTSKPATQPTTANVPMETTERAQSQDSPTTLSTVDQHEENEEDNTPAPHIPAERKPEITMEKDTEEQQKQDGEVPETTAVAFDDVEGTTVAAEDADQNAVKELSKPESSTDASVDEEQQKERVTTQRAFVPQDDEQESTTFATKEDKEQELEVRATTLKPFAEFEEGQKQEQPTTDRPSEQAADAVTEQEDRYDDQKKQQAADEIQSSTVRVDEPAETDNEDQTFDDVKQESTTSRLSDSDLPLESATERDEPVTVREQQTKQGAETTAAPSMLDELENEIEQSSTPVASLAMDEEATEKTQTQEEPVTTSEITGTTASSIAADTTSSKSELDDMDASTTKEPEQGAPALGDKVLEDAEEVQGSDEAAPSTTAPTTTAPTTTAPTTTAAPAKSDDSTEEEQKSTQELPASTTVEPTSQTDGSIVFRVDEDEESKPIVKPTLDDQKPTNVVDEKDDEKMPTKLAVEKDDAKTPPKVATEEEKDDDNLISPVVGTEQDGGFHYPQEKDETKPIFKPTLDEAVQSTSAPESDDQIKEHDEIESTSGASSTTKSEEEIRTTTQPEPAVTKGQQPEKHADESNEIDADLQEKPATEPTKPALQAGGADEPENTLVYDEIDESEQQSNVPSLTTPKGMPSETQRPELDEPVTSVPTTSSPVDDEKEQTVPTVHRQQEVTQGMADDNESVEENVTGQSKLETSSPASAVHSATTTEQADVMEQDQEQQKPVQSLDDSISKATVQPAKSSSALYDEKATTAVPLYPERDEEPSVDELEKPAGGADQDEPAATTVSSSPVAQDEENAEEQDSKQQELPAINDLDEGFGEHATTLRNVESESDSEQVTTEGAVNKQTLAAVTDRQTTIAPVQQEMHDDEKKPLTDTADEDEGSSDDQQEQHSAPAEKDEEQDETTKVPVAHAGTSDSGETSTDDDKNLDNVSNVSPTTTTIDSTEASVKPAHEAPEQDSGASDEDDDGPSRATTAAVPERDEDVQPHQPQSTESNDEKVEGTTTTPVKDDDVEQEPAFTTASDDQSKQPTTAAAPVEADEAQAESDETETKPDANEKETSLKEQSTTLAPSAAQPSTEADTTEASDDKSEEQDADEASEPVAHDETGGEEPAPATTLRTPVRVADDELVTDDEEPQEPVDSEGITAASPTVAHDDVTESDEEDKQAPEADDSQVEPKPTSTAAPVASDESEDDDVSATSEQPKPAVSGLSPVEAEPSQDKEDAQVPTTTAASVSEPERDQLSEEQPDEQEPSVAPVKPTEAEREQDKQPEATTVAAAAPAVHDDKDASQSEEEEEPETPQTDDLNADDDSSEEDNEPAAPSLVPTTTTAQPTPKAPSTAPPATSAKDEEEEKEDEDVPAEKSTTVAPLEAVTFSTTAPDSDSQVTEHPTTVRREEAPVTEQTPPSTTIAQATAAPAADAVEQTGAQTEAPHSEVTSGTDAPTTQQDEKQQQHSTADDSEQEPAVTGSSEVTTVEPTTTAPTTAAPTTASTTTAEATTTTEAATTTEQTTLAAQKPSPVATDKPQEQTPSTVAPALADVLDERFDDETPQVAQKPVSPPASDDKVADKPQEVSHDDSDEQQAIVKPTDNDTDDSDDDDDQQKVQEPSVAGESKPSEPEPSKPETVGPSYGAPGQHYESGYGHMPPHYPPSSYEEDYGEEEDPAAFGPGTCRYGGKLYVSAQQIPRDDPCDFCFCFRSDIICLQQSCPPPISGCNEEPISGFCCPRYECPVSMATVLNVTTSTTTTTTTLPPHFPSHAYKGQVQKRGCQIQGKPYNVGEMVASASGPCMRCTCGGDGQMQCEPKACSPEPMLQQMIAVAAARRR
uniref:VWFC domain-containing protein n=1 Tax=Anopheles atroparvus TaxID=41427 RepID=A0A182J4Q6_ANOAO